MYWYIVTVAKSVYRMSMVLPSLRLGYILGSSPATWRRLSSTPSALTASISACAWTTIWRFLVVAVTTYSCLDLSRHGFDISVLRYEDLVVRPLDMCRVILEFCHLLAVKAFDVDSQRSSVLLILRIECAVRRVSTRNRQVERACCQNTTVIKPLFCQSAQNIEMLICFARRALN